MKRMTLGALCAFAAALVIAAGGATSAYGLSTAGHQSVSAAGHESALRPAAQAGTLKNDDGNQFVCTSDGVAMADSAPGDDQMCGPISGSTGVCIEKTDAPVAVQTCTFTQTGIGSKHATVTQVAATDKGPSPQNHTQIVTIDQTSTLADSNFSDVSQTVKQSLGPGHFDDTDESEPDSATTSSPGSIMTQQDLHQVVTVTQNSATGNNSSAISQYGKQRARAKQALSISEHQNTLPAPSGQCQASDDTQANICSVVDQTSVSGQNISTLDDTLSQFARAHKTTGGDQQQGMAPGQGGINHEIHQSSAGFCKIDTKQRETQVLRAVQANVTQVQHGPVRKGAGSEQACNTASVWTGDQDSSQLATSRPTEADIGSLVFASSAAQDNLLEYFGVSAGSIHATQTASQHNNGGNDSTSNACPGTGGSSNVCAAVISCTEGFCSSSQDPNPCGPGEFPNPETGRCENID